MEDFFRRVPIKRRDAGETRTCKSDSIGTERKAEQAQHSSKPRPEQAQQFFAAQANSTFFKAQARASSTTLQSQSQSKLDTVPKAHHGIIATRAHPIGPRSKPHLRASTSSRQASRTCAGSCAGRTTPPPPYRSTPLPSSRGTSLHARMHDA